MPLPATTEHPHACCCPSRCVVHEINALCSAFPVLCDCLRATRGHTTGTHRSSNPLPAREVLRSPAAAVPRGPRTRERQKRSPAEGQGDAGAHPEGAPRALTLREQLALNRRERRDPRSCIFCCTAIACLLACPATAVERAVRRSTRPANKQTNKQTNERTNERTNKQTKKIKQTKRQKHTHTQPNKQ